MTGKQPEAEPCSRWDPSSQPRLSPPAPAAPQLAHRAPPAPRLHPIPTAAPAPRPQPGRTVLDEEDAPVPADAVGPPARQVQPVDVIGHGDSGGARGQSSPAPRRGDGTRLGKHQTAPGPPRSNHLLSSDLPPRLCLLQITKEGGKKKKNPNQTHGVNPVGAGVQRAPSQHPPGDSRGQPVTASSTAYSL